MSRVAYVNGRYVPLRDAMVHVEDRGYQLSDGVYDVSEVVDGRLIDEDRHWARLAYSLGELRIRPPMAESALRLVVRELVRRNRIRHGLVYLQVTRGRAPRNHAFPAVPVPPSLVITARRADPAAAARATSGIAVITVPETRWARVDIKTIGLLPNVLAKQAAKEAGAAEAWFVDAHGIVNEGSSSNAWIVTRGGEVVTAPVTAPILRGVTRIAVIEIAAALGIPVAERRFTLAEAHDAREAFITSTTTHVAPVVVIDGVAVGDGAPGPITIALREAFARRIAG
ncbi:MAG: D-amino-acid transaminase [Bauldia sp.]|nr:D-amino-acid transaminase [Bauldia sp.]